MEVFYGSRILSFKPFGNIASQLPVIVAIVEYDIHLLMHGLKLKSHGFIKEILALGEIGFNLGIELVDFLGENDVEVDNKAVVVHEVPAKNIKYIPETGASFEEINLGEEGLFGTSNSFQFYLQSFLQV